MAHLNNHWFLDVVSMEIARHLQILPVFKPPHLLSGNQTRPWRNPLQMSQICSGFPMADERRLMGNPSKSVGDWFYHRLALGDHTGLAEWTPHMAHHGAQQGAKRLAGGPEKSSTFGTAAGVMFMVNRC